MDVRFAPPELDVLDEANAEICACVAFADERPMRGVAGLCDWRLAGKLSAIAKQGFLVSGTGEVVMVPGRPRLPFDKILLFGLGPRAAFDDAAFRDWIERVKRTLGGLQVRRAMIEVAGRGVLPLARRAELLAEAALTPEMLDRFVFVEDEEGQRAIVQAMKQRELRVRSA